MKARDRYAQQHVARALDDLDHLLPVGFRFFIRKAREEGRPVWVVVG